MGKTYMQSKISRCSSQFIAYSADRKTKLEIVYQETICGGTCYGTAAIKKVCVAPGVEELVLDVDFNGGIFWDSPAGDGARVNARDVAWLSGIEVRLDSRHEACPGIKKIVLGEKIASVCFENRVFPNVREVESRSPYYASGGCLISLQLGPTLLNTFCRKPGETIDLAGIMAVGSGAFAGCKSANVINSSGIRYTNDQSFRDYEPEGLSGNLVIGATLIKADTEAECIEIPKQVAKAKTDAFEGAKARRVRILSIGSFEAVAGADYESWPHKLTLEVDIRDSSRWADNARACFATVSSFDTIEVSENDPLYKSADGIVYSKDGAALILCPPGREKEVHVAEGTKCIEPSAFSHSKVTGVHLPDSLVTIMDEAFNRCPIREVRIPKNVTYIGDDNFQMASRIILEGKRPIEGLIEACAKGQPSYSMEEVKNCTTAIIEVGDAKIALPRGLSEYKCRPDIDAWNHGVIMPSLQYGVYLYAETETVKQDTALETLMLYPGNEAARKYLLDNSGIMARRYIDYMEGKQLVKMAKLNLLPKDTIAELLNNSSFSAVPKAYILEALKSKPSAEMEL